MMVVEEDGDRESLRLGVDDFVQKPFESEALRLRVINHLKRISRR
jgi:DNA-binding response OmpR family regulator